MESVKKDLFVHLPLHGRRVQLTAVEQTDLDALLPFFQDISSLYYYIPTTARPLNSSQLEKMLLDWNDGIENFCFAVRTADETIGLINIDGLDWPNSHAEVGIALASPAARGKGYALEALMLLVDFAFKELGLNRLWARIIADNEASQRLFAKAGFVHEGIMRRHVLRGGCFRDMHIYGIISNNQSCQKQS